MALSRLLIKSLRLLNYLFTFMSCSKLRIFQRDCFCPIFLFLGDIDWDGQENPARLPSFPRMWYRVQAPLHSAETEHGTDNCEGANYVVASHSFWCTSRGLISFFLYYVFIFYDFIPKYVLVTRKDVGIQNWLDIYIFLVL